MNIAFFDFDGTISFKDSFASFLRFCNSPKKLYLGALLLAPYIIGYKLKIISNQKAKQKVLKYFYGGMKEAEFNALCQSFSEQILPKICRSKAMQCLQKHKNNGDKVVIISASPLNYLAPWCDKNGFELLATRLQVRDGRISGLIDGFNCYGEHKVRLIKEHYDLSAFCRIYAYGDSRGDLPMLNLANESHYKPFRV